uniref:Uncharacterized protein n=1 Tax=Cacopsylla melanoneura TaxID=428564 RepID=A0A8D8UHB4_9HEMI
MTMNYGNICTVVSLSMTSHCSIRVGRCVLNLFLWKTVTMPIHGKKVSVSCTAGFTFAPDIRLSPMIQAGRWLTLKQYRRHLITGMSLLRAHPLYLYILVFTGENFWCLTLM